MSRKVEVSLTKQSTDDLVTGSLAGQTLLLSQDITETRHFNLVQGASSSGGIGIYVPQVKVILSSASDHDYHEHGSAVTAKNNLIPAVNLSYESTGSYEWTNYNPRYFLFIRKHIHRKNLSGGHNFAFTRETTGFVHPTNQTPDGLDALFSNYSSNSIQPTDISTKYPYSSFEVYKWTEWPVNYSLTINGVLKTDYTRISSTNGIWTNGFHPSQYVTRAGNPNGSTPIFPIPVADWNVDYSRSSGDYIQISRNGKRFGQSPTKTLLSFRFAICVNINGTMVLGPFSEIIKLRPVMGYFTDVGGLTPYFYKWTLSRY
jgi:hypothetical protein